MEGDIDPLVVSQGEISVGQMCGALGSGADCSAPSYPPCSLLPAPTAVRMAYPSFPEEYFPFN